MAVKDKLLDLVFPRRCVVCDEITDRTGKALCSKCQGKILYIKEPCCMKCGKQLKGGEQEYCGDCRKKKHNYIQGTSLYDYGSMSDSLFRFKYAGRMEYADFYGRELAEKKARWLSMIKPDVLIPVPVHPSRKRKRGYNQAELIAGKLSRYSGIPIDTSLISRERKTQPLKNLSYAERQNNLKKAFKIRQNDVKLSTIVIIDDIYTTGSTIDAMAQAFTEVGISGIYFITLTIGRGI